eukprot:gene57564-biopygen100560
MRLPFVIRPVLKEIVQVGKGTFGVVFRGIDRATGEHVAMKVFPVGNKKVEELKQIEAEHELMKNLAHRNLVQIHAFEVSKSEATLGGGGGNRRAPPKGCRRKLLLAASGLPSAGACSSLSPTLLVMELVSAGDLRKTIRDSAPDGLGLPLIKRKGHLGIPGAAAGLRCLSA